MECEICLETFDKVAKVPLSLPCGHSFCKKCLLELETSNKPRTCPVDREEFKEAVSSLKKNFTVINIMDKLPMRTAGKYFCSKHPKEEFKFRCNLHKDFLCSLCIWDHADHKKQVDIYTEEELLRDISELDGKIDIKIAELQKQKQIVQDIKKGKVSTTDQIKDAFAKVLESFPNLDEKKAELFPFSLSRGLAPAISHGDIDQSTILKIGEATTVMNWLPNPLSKTKLLLRGSVDGYTSATFHQKCDNKGRTLCIFKSNLNKIFGAYSCLNWNANVNNYSQDTTNSCFVFSVTNKSKHLLKNQANAIYCNASYGPTFGGHDIYISNNNTASNNCNLGVSYTADGIADPRSYLAGAFNFTLLDYEVYQITN